MLWTGLLVGSMSIGCGMSHLEQAEPVDPAGAEIGESSVRAPRQRNDALPRVATSENVATSPVPSRASFFADHDADTVIDARNGLEWQRAVGAELHDWKHAIVYCAELPLAGGGWHLPTKPELESIIDDTTFEPAVDPQAFPDTPADVFWSSSPRGASAAWGVTENGHSVPSDASSVARVRCVRGELPTITERRFAVSASGTVHDKLTGLTWQATVARETFIHDAAVDHCAALSVQSTGWRLPTRGELLTLADESRALPAIDSNAFPGTPSESFFWSSTRYAAASDKRWIVYFDAGKSNYTDVTAAGYVRCVR